MYYDLAKQLKDAGFPQKLWNFSYHPSKDLCSFAYDDEGEFHLLHHDNDEGGSVGNDYSHRENANINWTACPTLSGLIEACGRRFEWLGLYSAIPYGYNNDLYFNKDKWVCGKWNCPIYHEGDYFTEDSRGHTPEEAIANLWLILNKHD